MTSRHAGLTLIELLIVIAVLAILLTTAVPNFTALLQEQRTISAANGLVTHLNFARQTAVMQGLTVTACPSWDLRRCSGDNQWHNGILVFKDPQRRGQPQSDADILRAVGPQPALQMVSGGRHRVRFQPSGAAYGSNLTIRVCDPRHADRGRAVIVSNPGRVRAARLRDGDDCLT